MSRKRKKSSNDGISCFMVLFVYWWLLPLKMLKCLFWDIPVAIASSICGKSKQQKPSNIFQRGFRIKDAPQINYNNNKKYGDYAVSGTGMFSILNIDQQISAYTKQAQDSDRICYSTTDPLVFFYRYDFMIKRYIDMISMSKYTDFQFIDAYSAYCSAINTKQVAVKSLITRCADKCRTKIATLKTANSKRNNIDKFQSQFFEFADEISPENQQYIAALAEDMRLSVK